MSPERIKASLIVLIAILAGAVGLSRLGLSTQITHFLPGGEESALTRLSQTLAESEIVRTIIVTAETGDRAQSIAVSDALAERLRGIDGVDWVRNGVDDAMQTAVKDLYFDRRYFFVDDRPDRIDLSEPGLRSRARALKTQLALPTSALIRPMATADPLLAFYGHLMRMQAARVGDLDVAEGRFVAEEGRYAVLFLATRGSPFRGQGEVLAELEAAFASVDAQVEMSAVHRFAVASERSIKADITRISVVSTIGILLLFLLVFRSLRPVLLTFVPVAVGIFMAVAASASVFQTIHGITLAFGCSMIGVCIDYGVHLINHHTLAGDGETPRSSLAKVWPGLLLGAATTIAGLFGLVWTTFPGIQEIALFSVVGVAAALAATRWVLPAFLPARSRPVPFQQRLADRLGAVMTFVERNRRGVMLMWMPLIVVAAWGYPRLAWNDQLSALNHLDPALLAEDARVRKRVSRMEGGQIVAVIGDDLEDALRKNDRVYQILSDSDDVETFRSLHTFLWSASLQRANAERFEGADLRATFDTAFAAEGFTPEAFQPFHESVTATVAPLTFEDLLASPFAPMVRPFRAPVGERVALFTFLRGVRDAGALEASLAPVPEALFFDQKTFLTVAYGDYRQRALELVGLGLIAVFLIVLLRYRRLRLALAAFLPALLAAGTTLGLLGLLGMEANLMHLVAILLVLSIGVDYGVFMVEHRAEPEARSATLLSIVIACFTTVLSFGTLAMSVNPALRALGVAVGAGVLLALILAPTALGLLAKEDAP